MSKERKTSKLILSKETLRKLAHGSAAGGASGAHPTTTVNTIKTGCC